MIKYSTYTWDLVRALESESPMAFEKHQQWKMVEVNNKQDDQKQKHDVR